MTRQAGIAIFFLALGLRVGYVVAGGMEAQDFYAPDSPLYEALADDMISTEGFNRRTSVGIIPETERVPLYIAYLAGFRLIAGDVALWPVLGQCALDAATCVLIAMLAAELWRELFVLAGVLAALNLNLIVHASMILPDTLFALLLTAHLVFMVRFVQFCRPLDAALTGTFFALAVLTRGLILYFIPIWLLSVALAAWHRGFKWNRIGQILLVSILPILVLLGPLLVRNFQAFGHLSLTSQAGTHALFWVVPLSREFSRGTPFKQSQAEMRERLGDHLAKQGFDDLPVNPFDASEQLITVAKGALREMSVLELVRAWGAGALINLFAPSLSSVPAVNTMERPRFYETSGSTPLEKIWNFLMDPRAQLYLMFIAPAIAITISLRAASLWGLVCGLKSKTLPLGPVLYLLCLGLYILAVTGPLVGVKYRLPLEPMLTVFTAAGFYCLFLVFQGHTRPRLNV